MCAVTQNKNLKRILKKFVSIMWKARCNVLIFDTIFTLKKSLKGWMFKKAFVSGSDPPMARNAIAHVLNPIRSNTGHIAHPPSKRNAM